MAKSKDVERLRRHSEALNALERLKLYEGQQEEGNKTLITALIKAERVIQGRRVTQVKQMTITSFFK